jgi:uncharacterized protein
MFAWSTIVFSKSGEYAGDMNLVNQAGVDEPLTDAEYDRLGEILDHLPGENVMDLEEMDGFFTALNCAPALIPPSVYFKEIWGGEEAPFETIDDLEEFFSLAMRHWNSVSRQLGSKDEVFIPWLGVEEGEEFPKGNWWALGFFRGVALSGEGWEELLASEDEDKAAMLLPVLALAHENDPDPELRPWKTPPDEERRKELIAGLCITTRMVYDYFRPHRIREAKHTQFRRTTPKIGRNDPCFCGSGRKYKKCCGNVTIN